MLAQLRLRGMLAKQAHASQSHVFAAFESRGTPSDLDTLCLGHLRPLRGGGLSQAFSDKPGMPVLFACFEVRGALVGQQEEVRLALLIDDHAQALLAVFAKEEVAALVCQHRQADPHVLAVFTVEHD